MEINLILAAQRWQLAEQLERTKPHGGLIMIKNVRERTYLAVTPAQWLVLVRFEQPRMVPQMLEEIITERLCPALGEFYELILKAVRARILVEPGYTVEPVPAVNWTLEINPIRVRLALWALFTVGLGFSLVLPPVLPPTVLALAASLVVWLVTSVLGAALAASLLRGAGGEVYARQHRLLNLGDTCMLPPSDQRTVILAPLAVFATATALLGVFRPEWAIFPVAGLLGLLRPILGGRINRMIRVGAGQRLSDAAHDYVFPPNRSPRVRWRLLRDSLRSRGTWLEIGYGIAWTLVLAYFIGVLTGVPSWQLAFWETQGPRLAGAVGGSLLVLALVYGGSEFYLFARDRARARHETLRQWYHRWFGRNAIATDEKARQRAVLRSPLLRLLPPPEQHALAKALQPHRTGPWKTLHDFSAPVDRISLILSGRVGVYRKLRSGRRVLVQVLCEDELVGLHAVADPQRPEFLFRTLSPVLLLRLDWAQTEALLLPRVKPAVMANLVQKLPFLARISLCQNWHRQAIQRFAELSRITDYAKDEVILQERLYSDNFFIVFEGEARITSGPRLLGTIRGSAFFGEIGLLQNSSAVARVTAGEGTRCLCIMRREFLRFVSNNYTVALELERVSSKRLGRPIFPLSPGNFQTH